MSVQVPTNIITGFLGVGKTTTIIHLLKNKPKNEKWAILVNEFGEIGIDGALLENQGGLVKEVPGGCMCCVAGLPMSVGVNALLRQKPDRLIIEPTGLGHPKEIIAILTSEQYAPYVDLKATVALLDARNLSNTKYTNNQNFNDQLAVSDIVIANKSDQYSALDTQAFENWSNAQQPKKNTTQFAVKGDFDLQLLDAQRTMTVEIDSHTHQHISQDIPELSLAPGEQFLRKENKGQGYFSCGWFFGAETEFAFDDLFSVFSDLTAERIKAVVNTDKGCFAFNVANQVVSVNELTLDGFESKIEVIDSQLLPWQQLEDVLMSIIK
jgi:G3E family GTPase